MTTLSTWEAELWNVDWSSKEGLKIFKAILLLKNPRGPEQERVSSALWLCCWRITGDSLCISESGPVKDSFPSPSRLCQKQRSSYKPRQVHLLFTLLPVYPVTPSSPDLISLRWSNTFPFLQAQSHQHMVFALHDLSPWAIAGCTGAVCLQPCPFPMQSLVFMVSLSLLHPKGDENPSWGRFPQTFCATLLLQKGTSPPAGSLWRNKSCCLATCHLQQWHPLLSPPSLHLPCTSLWAMPISWVTSQNQPKWNSRSTLTRLVFQCVYLQTMTWFTNLLAQQRRKDHCSPGANHPEPAECGERTSIGTGTIT